MGHKPNNGFIGGSAKLLRTLIATVLAVLCGVGYTASAPAASAAGSAKIISSRQVFDGPGEGYENRAAKADRRAVFTNNTGAEGAFILSVRGTTGGGVKVIWARANVVLAAGDGFFRKLSPGQYTLRAKNLDGEIISVRTIVVRERRDYTLSIGNNGGSGNPPPTAAATIIVGNATGVPMKQGFTISSAGYLGGFPLGYNFASTVPSGSLASVVPPTTDIGSYSLTLNFDLGNGVNAAFGVGAGVGTTSADGKTRTVIVERNTSGTFTAR